MNVDDLKLAWQASDAQGHLPPLPHALVHVLIQQRSRGRLAELHRTLAWQGAVAVGSSPLWYWLVWRNPFGLTHWYSFVPPLAWASAVLLMGGLLLATRWRIRQRTRRQPTLREALADALAQQNQALAWLGRLSLLGQLAVFATIGAFTAEHWAQMRALEAGAAGGSLLLFAGLTLYYFQTRYAPRAARLDDAQRRQWLAELAELEAAHS